MLTDKRGLREEEVEGSYSWCHTPRITGSDSFKRKTTCRRNSSGSQRMDRFCLTYWSELTYCKNSDCGVSRNIQQVGNLSLYMDVHVHQYLPQLSNLWGAGRHVGKVPRSLAFAHATMSCIADCVQCWVNTCISLGKQCVYAGWSLSFGLSDGTTSQAIYHCVKWHLQPWTPSTSNSHLYTVTLSSRQRGNV